MKKFIRFVAKNCIEGINDLTTEWMDTEITDLVDIIEMANVMRSIVSSTNYFKGVEPDIEEADADEVLNNDKILSVKKEINSLYGKNMIKASEVLKDDNIYITCSSKEQCIDLIKYFVQEKGCVWYGDLTFTNWEVYKDKICYYVSKVYNPDRYVLRTLKVDKIPECYTDTDTVSYKIYRWEDVIHG